VIPTVVTTTQSGIKVAQTDELITKETKNFSNSNSQDLNGKVSELDAFIQTTSSVELTPAKVLTPKQTL